MIWYPHVTVATVVEKGGKFLLVEEQADDRWVLNQPAGHLEAEETLQQAAVRETLEETAWTIALQGVVGLGLYLAPQNQVTYQRVTFFGDAIAHDPERVLDDGIRRALWLDYEEILAESDRMRSRLVIEVIERYRNGHRYPLDMIY